MFQRRFLGMLIAACVITGCSPQSATTSSIPAAAAADRQPSATLSTNTWMTTVDASTPQALRLPENSLGGIPLFQLSVSLYDAPLTFGPNDHVNLALLETNVLSNGVAHSVSATSTPQIVDILQLQRNPLSINGRVPAGTYDTLQLVVSPAASSVVIGGVTYPVAFGKLPAGSSQLVAINAATFVSSTHATKHLAVDINALESIALANGVATFNPQLVVSGTGAQVRGIVRNAAGAPVTAATIVVQDRHGRVLNSAVSSADGTFVVHALPAGTVHVTVLNKYVSASGITVTASGADAWGFAQADAQLAGGVDLDLGTLTD